MSEKPNFVVDLRTEIEPLAPEELDKVNLANEDVASWLVQSGKEQNVSQVNLFSPDSAEDAEQAFDHMARLIFPAAKHQDPHVKIYDQWQRPEGANTEQPLKVVYGGFVPNTGERGGATQVTLVGRAAETPKGPRIYLMELLLGTPEEVRQITQPTTNSS